MDKNETLEKRIKLKRKTREKDKRKIVHKKLKINAKNPHKNTIITLKAKTRKIQGKNRKK